jgi:hypothetical protein
MVNDGNWEDAGDKGGTQLIKQKDIFTYYRLK